MVAKDPSFLHVGSEDMPVCWFCHEAAHIYSRIVLFFFQMTERVANLLIIVTVRNGFQTVIYMYRYSNSKAAPRGQSFNVNRNVLSFHSFDASFKKMPLKSDFIQFVL